MPINEGKLNPGIEYQFLVIAYTAACLSEKEDVEDFEIYTNQDDVPYFDDIIVKVKYKSQSKSFVYMGQIKRYKKAKMDLNEGDEELDTLLHYIRKVKDEENRKQFLKRLLEDVPEENIEFWYFSNSFFKNPSKHNIFLRDGTQCHVERNTEEKSIFPLANSDVHDTCDVVQKSIHLSKKPVASCYNVSAGKTHEYAQILSKLYFFLNQPDHHKIPACIVGFNPDIFSIKTANNICNYVYMYLRKCQIPKITKHVFETELLRLCLSSFTVSPTKALKVDPQLADIWNELVLRHDVTVIDNTSTEIKPHIFGCLWQNIMKLYDCALNWNELITDFKKINKIIANNKFIELSKAKKFRHWLFPPDTIEDFLYEMWKSNYLPMVLSSDTNIYILKKYKHLKKSFVLLDNNQELYNEISDFRVFANAADIREVELGNEFLKKIFISLQGREPVDIFSIINDDGSLMKNFKCGHMLQLVKESRIFLRKQALLNTDSTIFIIADDSDIANQRDVDDAGNNKNVIKCRSSEVDFHATKIKDDPKMENYSIYNLQVNDGKLELIKGERFNLRQYIVDEDGNDLYIKDDIVVPIIGKCFEKNAKYISRYLRKATVKTSILDMKKGIVCFLSGNVSSSSWTRSNRNEFIQGFADIVTSKIEDKLVAKEHAIVALPCDDIEQIWSRLSPKQHSLLHVHVEVGVMSLVKYQNCPNIDSQISYNGAIFNETFFFEETSTGVTVITGEPGAGKSTLLRSLFNTCDKHSYALFCDLNDYRHDLRDSNSELFNNPIKFMLKKEKDQVNNQYFDFLNNFIERKQELIVFLDSFDEILPVCQKEVLHFIRNLTRFNIRLIIASRLLMADILINSMDVKPIKIDTLNAKNIKEYINKEKLSEDQFNKYPPEFRENPLYLNFLISLHQANSLPAAITKSSLYNAIIEKHIERYYNKKSDFYTSTQYTYLKRDILDVHKSLALVQIFDAEVIKMTRKSYKELKRECINTDKVKLGLIIRFNEDRPVFLHQTFAEFLAVQWLIENLNQGCFRDIYMTWLQENGVYMRRLLDDILCEELTLHKAVIGKDLTLVETLCSEDDIYLKQVDKLNRTALHLASIYCSNIGAQKENYMILETLIRHMKTKKIDFNTYDSIIKWTWFKYLELNNLLLRVLYQLTATSEMYFVCAEKIEEGIKWAFENDSFDVAVALVKRDICILPKFFNNYVITALALDRLNILCELIELQNYNNTQFDILCRACRSLVSVTEVSACVNLKIYGGFTAMHITCMYGSIDVVKELLNLKVEVDAFDNFEFKPLYYAVAQGSTEIVTYLMKHKSFLKQQNEEVNFISRLLVNDSPANLKFYNLVFQPYLHISIYKNYVEIAEILLKNGFDINEKNIDGKTALHVAVQSNFPETHSAVWSLRILRDVEEHIIIDQIKLLLKHKSICNIQDNLGNTPLHIAVINNLINVTQVLLQHGAKTNVRTNSDLFSPLEIAIICRNSKILELLLKFGADSNLEHKCGKTPLHFASEINYYKENNIEDIIKALLKAGANVNHRNKIGNTALHTTIQNNDVKLVKLLLAFDADVNIESSVGLTALQVAIAYNCFYNANDTIKVLLEAGANVNHKNKSGDAALHIITRYYSQYYDSLIELLLAYGADVDIEDGNGETPLHVTIKYCHRHIDNAVTKKMLRAGVNVNHKNKTGDTALHMAMRHENASLVETLLANRADVDVENKYGDTPLHVAVEYKYFHRYTGNIIRILLEAGATVNHQNKRGDTALHVAIRCDDKDIVESLVTYGADVDIENKSGETPLHFAILYKYFNRNAGDIIKILLEAGVTINHQNLSGKTVLHIAARRGDEDLVELLLGYGADVDIEDGDGDTALSIAIRLSNTKIITMLM